jgi:repressor LexA
MPTGARNKQEGERRRAAILSFVSDFIEKQGYPPTIREIAAGTGLVSPGATHRQLRKLVDAGELELTPRGFRPCQSSRA